MVPHSGPRGGGGLVTTSCERHRVPSWQPFYKLLEKGANDVTLAHLKLCDANRSNSLRDSVSSDHRRASGDSHASGVLVSLHQYGRRVDASLQCTAAAKA